MPDPALGLEIALRNISKFVDTTEMDTNVGLIFVTTSDTEVIFPFGMLSIPKFSLGFLETMVGSNVGLTCMSWGSSIFTGEEQPVKTCRLIQAIIRIIKNPLDLFLVWRFRSCNFNTVDF